MAQQWYDTFYDSLGTMDPNAKIVYLDSAKKNVNQKQEKEFTVELARYKGGIPTDEMAFLLSIGDVQSFNMGDEIVVYVAGSYNDIRMAVKRRDEFREEGLKSAKLGYFKGETYYALSEDEAAREIAEAEKKNTGPVSTTPSIGKDQVVYRVQLGAYKTKLPAGVFKDVGDVIVLQTEDGYYRYCSGAYKTLNDAAFHRAELVLEGYGDAFVTAYKGGKRIRMSEAGATYEKEEEAKRETIDEKATTVSSFNKDAVMFRIQIGTLKQANDNAFEERVAKLKDVIKQPTSSGLMRYMVGEFKNYNDAVKHKNKLAAEGYPEAFVIATFKGEVISIQEALELLK
jgi:cell division protein FtsN